MSNTLHFDREVMSSKNYVSVLFEECQAKKILPPKFTSAQDPKTGQWTVHCVVQAGEKMIDHVGRGDNVKQSKEFASRLVYDELKKMHNLVGSFASLNLSLDIDAWRKSVVDTFTKFGFQHVTPNMLSACVHPSVLASPELQEVLSLLKPIQQGSGRFAMVGDAVISLFIAEDCFMSQASEEHYTTVRGSISSNHHMATLFENKWPYSAYLTSGIVSEKMKADLVEAIVGAVYLDCGLIEAKRLYRQLWG